MSAKCMENATLLSRKKKTKKQKQTKNRFVSVSNEQQIVRQNILNNLVPIYLWQSKGLSIGQSQCRLFT